MDIRWVLPFLLFVLILLIPGRALAQGAWVPRQGEAAFSISYQWLDAKRHAIDNSGLSPFEAWLGQDFDSNEVTAFGRVSAMSMVLDAEVGVTEEGKDLVGDLREGRTVGDVRIVDPVDRGGRLGDRALGIDPLRQDRGAAVRLVTLEAEFDDAVDLGVDSSGFEIEENERTRQLHDHGAAG